MKRKNHREQILQKQETLQCSEQKFCQKNTNDKPNDNLMLNQFN